MYICIGCLSMVIALRGDNETVIGVNISRFVHCVIARACAIRCIATNVARWRLILRAGRERKVH